MGRGPSYLLPAQDREYGLVIPYSMVILCHSLFLEGRVIRKRLSGRPRVGMLDRVKDGGPYVAVKMRALDREL